MQASLPESRVRVWRHATTHGDLHHRSPREMLLELTDRLLDGPGAFLVGKQTVDRRSAMQAPQGPQDLPNNSRALRPEEGRAGECLEIGSLRVFNLRWGRVVVIAVAQKLGS